MPELLNINHNLELLCIAAALVCFGPMIIELIQAAVKGE
jgi:hypothetical protein